MKRFLMAAVLMLGILSTPLYAAHPLITDDTGTQGKGKFQIEVNAEHANDNGNTETALGATLSAGLTDTIDIVLGMPYLFLREKDETGQWTREGGISDISLALKWRLYEREGLSFALKPGVTLPTGDKDMGLGDGKPSYSLFLITTRELEPFTFHLNIGYITSRSEFRDTFHYSLAAEFAATKNIKLVGNIGGETNPDRESITHPLFALGGVIFKITDCFDIDIGAKAGLNRAEADYALLTGLIFRF